MKTKHYYLMVWSVTNSPRAHIGSTKAITLRRYARMHGITNHTIYTFASKQEAINYAGEIEDQDRLKAIWSNS